MSIIGAYSLGAIPFGVILARLHGKDLRQIGSGNIGATNLGRALGRPWAIICFCLDASKGLLPMVLVHRFVRPHYLNQGGQEGVFLWLWILCGCAAVLGHIFPIYIGFRGGKGVSTSFGVALGVWPYFTIAALVSIVVWVIVLKVSRYVSLASMIGASTFPLVLLGLTALIPSWSLTQLRPLVCVALAIPILVVYLHRSNIRRLYQGTENRTGSDKKHRPHNDG